MAAALGGLTIAAFSSPGAQATETLYAADSTISSVSAFSIAADGGLGAVGGSPFPADSLTEFVTATPSGKYVYATNTMAGDVSAFSVGPTGALTPVVGSPFPAGNNPKALAVTPNGQYLYEVDLFSPDARGFAIGATGSLTPVSGSPFPTGAGPDGVAITPDGNHLYVANSSGPGNVSGYSIAASGSLTPISGSPFSTGAEPAAIAVTPDGRFLYVTDDNGVEAFSIGTNGGLNLISGSPFGTCCTPSLAITPDGGHLYAPNQNTASVAGYAIASSGALTAVTGSPFGVGTNPRGAAVTPNGSHLYVSASTSMNVSGFSIASDGSLSPVSGSPFAAGTNVGPVVILPDQGPVAAFSATAAPADSATSFSGLASTDPDGTVARYDWSFGDGASGQNGGPTPAHTYAAPGTYTVTLTVTDNAGCSTAEVFTGQTASCNASAAARTTQQVHVPVPPLSHLKLKPRKFFASRSGPSVARAQSGTTVSYRDTFAATSIFTVLESLPGVKHGRDCVAPAHRASKHRPRPCKRVVTLGHFTHHDVSGRNRFRFTGRIRRRALAPGAYMLSATARLDGLTAKPVVVRFRID